MEYTAFYLTHSYFVCHPESVAELWEENQMLFRSDPTYWSANSIWEPVSHELNLEHHKWKWIKKSAS